VFQCIPVVTSVFQLIPLSERAHISRCYSHASQWLQINSYRVFLPRGKPLHLVLDTGGAHAAVSMTQPYDFVFTETLPKGDGYTWAQFVYLFADMYTDSEYIAFMDSE
jgi:hypothetical protein